MTSSKGTFRLLVSYVVGCFYSYIVKQLKSFTDKRVLPVCLPVSIIGSSLI